MSAPDLDARTSRAVQRCLVGATGEFTRAFVVESGVDAAFLSSVVTSDDVVMVPTEYRFEAGDAFTVEYAGALREPGDEMHIAGHRIEVQDYVAAAFSESVGATVVVIADAAGWRAFVEDADLARATGVLPAPLVDPRMQLADRAALSAPWTQAPPADLWIRADGAVTLGPRGRGLGDVADLPAVLAAEVPGFAALEGAVDRSLVVTALIARQWLGRYLRVADLARTLRLDLGADAISGFGWSVVDDDAADADPEDDDPILVRTAGEHHLAALSTRRRQRLAEPTAAIVEIVQTSSDPGRADERIAARLSVDLDRARMLSEQAIDQLGVRRGRVARSLSHADVAAGGTP